MLDAIARVLRSTGKRGALARVQIPSVVLVVAGPQLCRDCSLGKAGKSFDHDPIELASTCRDESTSLQFSGRHIHDTCTRHMAGRLIGGPQLARRG